MYLNTLEVKLNQRKSEATKLVEINPKTLSLLKLIFEFKIVTATHMSRFMSGVEESKYLYKKLRQIWLTGILESFNIYSGNRISPTVYYMLSKKGINALIEYNKISKKQSKYYPVAKDLMSTGQFKHEAQIVELASWESKLNRGELNLNFSGELSSQNLSVKDDKTVEALSPDYVVLYERGQNKNLVFTEFERTKKSFQAMQSKIAKYISFFFDKEISQITIRMIFQTPQMEKSFWINTILNQPNALRLNILTTNLELIKNENDFLKGIYANESSANLTKNSKLNIEIINRVKLFNFLGSDP